MPQLLHPSKGCNFLPAGWRGSSTPRRMMVYSQGWEACPGCTLYRSWNLPWNPCCVIQESLRRTSSGWGVGVGGKALAWAVRRHGFQSHPDPEQFIVSVGLSCLSSGRLTPPIDSPHLIFWGQPRVSMLSHPAVGAEPMLWGRTDLDLNSVSGT